MIEFRVLGALDLRTPEGVEITVSYGEQPKLDPAAFTPVYG